MTGGGGDRMGDKVRKVINIRIEEELLEEIDMVSEEMSLSRSALIRVACIEYLKKRNANKE